MTKPRLIRFRGVWHCYLHGYGEFHVLCGLGHTPAAAWVDWKRMQNRKTDQ